MAGSLLCNDTDGGHNFSDCSVVDPDPGYHVHSDPAQEPYRIRISSDPDLTKKF